MTVFEKGLLTILGCNALLALVSLPLALRKVPRNRVYGYRTRASLASDAVWYDANAYFGRASLVACLVATFAAYLVSRSLSLDPGTYLMVSVVILAAPVAVAGLLTSRYVRTLDAR